MSRIIGKAPENIEKHVVCTNCASIIAYLPLDINDMASCDISGHREVEHYIECPACHYRLWI